MAQIHALVQPLLVTGSLWCQMAVDEALRSVAQGRIGGREPTVNEGEQGPDGIGPSPRRPCPVWTQMLQEACAPAFLNGSAAFGLPDILGLATEIAHRLPGNHGIAVHQPVNDTIAYLHCHPLLALLGLGTQANRSQRANEHN